MLDAVKATDFDGLDLLPADFTYRHMDIDLNERTRPERTLRKLLRPLATEYDVVLLDVPPSLSLVSENVLTAADLVLAPLIPTVLSVRTFEQLTDFIADFYDLGGRRSWRSSRCWTGASGCTGKSPKSFPSSATARSRRSAIPARRQSSRCRCTAPQSPQPPPAARPPATTANYGARPDPAPECRLQGFKANLGIKFA